MTNPTNLGADVLLIQRDDLLAALEKVLDTRKVEEQAWFASHNAHALSPDGTGGAQEHERHMAAIEAMKAAEREAHVLLATLRR